MNASELYYKAAEIISERGLAKKKAQDEETGAVCMSGALSLAWYGTVYFIVNDHEYTTAWRCIEASACMILQDRGKGLHFVDFNDAPETSKEDVILLLKECGSRLEI